MDCSKARQDKMLIVARLCKMRIAARLCKMRIAERLCKMRIAARPGKNGDCSEARQECRLQRG